MTAATHDKVWLFDSAFAWALNHSGGDDAYALIFADSYVLDYWDDFAEGVSVPGFPAYASANTERL